MLCQQAFFSLNTLPHTSVGLTSCISIVFLDLNILTHITIMLHVGSLKVPLMGVGGWGLGVVGC